MKMILKNIFKKLQFDKKLIQYFFLSIFVKYSTFLFDIIVIHKLSKENFGKYSLILLVANLAFTFGFSWHSSVLLYIGAKEKAIRGKFNHTFHARNIITLSFIVIIALAFFLGREFLNDYMGVRVVGIVLIYVFFRVFSIERL